MVNIYRPTANDSLSLSELQLYKQLMAYRTANGLDEIPLSKALTVTAGRHAVDTYYNIWVPDLRLPDGANLHSWSDAPYYGDHRDPEVMWDAPERIGTGFTGNGYEITAAGYANTADALDGWKGSPGHNSVILNLGGWSGIDFNSIGIGIEYHPGGAGFGTIYHVWFSDTADSSGPPNIRATSGSDDVTATRFADRLFGLNGNDTLSGSTGSDTVSGGGGNDSVSGGSGRDRLAGDKGDDTLTGGSGADRFVFADGGGRDRITDFSAALGDRLLLDDALWGGADLSAAQVVDRYATMGRTGAVFTFDDGEVLSVAGVSALAQLVDRIDFA